MAEVADEMSLARLSAADSLLPRGSAYVLASKAGVVGVAAGASQLINKGATPISRKARKPSNNSRMSPTIRLAVSILATVSIALPTPPDQQVVTTISVG